MAAAWRDRIDYGRAVRLRAICLIEAHGRGAEAMIRSATAEPGLPIAERTFLEAVAARVARLTATPPRLP
jgi:hypothetical protein